MEEEDEEEDLDLEEQEPLSPSDLGGVPWREAVELHSKLRGNEDEALADAVSRDREVDEDDEEYEDEDEDEDDDDDESSDGKLVFSLLGCDLKTVFP